MKYGLVFLILAGICAWQSATVGPLLIRYFTGNAALALTGVSAAYMLASPRILMKRGDGSLPALSWLVFWPYVLLSGLLLALARRLSHGNAFDEIVPGLFLGGRLFPREQCALMQTPLAAVLDLTSEFPEAPALRSTYAYKTIPLLDATAPSQWELHDGVEWLVRHAAKGGLYVHCAAGHGRSATFVAAYLLHTAISATPAEAISLIAQRRPGIRINPEQQKALEAYASGLTK